MRRPGNEASTQSLYVVHSPDLSIRPNNDNNTHVATMALTPLTVHLLSHSPRTARTSERLIHSTVDCDENLAIATHQVSATTSIGVLL